MRNTLPLTLADQAILSGFAIGANLLLLSLSEPESFGLFAYTLAVVLIFTSLQNALVCMPIAVYLPTRTGNSRDRLLGALWRVDLLYRAGAGIAAGAIFASLDARPAYVAAAIGLTMTSLWRETTRSTLFAAQAFARCLALDSVAVTASALAALALWTRTDPVVAALAGMALGNAVAVLMLGYRPRPGPISTPAAISTWLAYWGEVRWSVAGVAATEAQHRSYVFMVEWLRGLDALGQIQAGRVLMGPLTLAVTAWGRVARSSMAGLLDTGRRREALSMLTTGLALLAVLICAYGLVLCAAWPHAEALLFRGRYPEIGLLTACWFVYAAIDGLGNTLGVFLQAARRFRALAFSTLAASAASLVLLGALVLDVPATYAVMAIIAGGCVAICWIGHVVLAIARQADTDRADRGPRNTVAETA